jgi:ppGpp synthetase/RelA/SpoT-type nucleotidyltranferase
LPARGLPLGLRLGLLVAATVVLVLGGVTALQQRREMAREWRDREALLAESLAPLAAEIEAASTLEEIRDQLASFQQAYVWRGYPDHQVALLDGNGGTVTASLPGAAAPPEKALRASLAVQSALLAGGIGQLDVWQDASVFLAESTARWRLRWFNIALTAVIIVAVLQVAIFILISRPLSILVRSLRRMEMGYLGPIEVPRGAWELRWVVSRLERTAAELQQTVRRMVAAERRALQQRRITHDPLEVFTGDNERAIEPAAAQEAVSSRDLLVRQYLQDTCRLLSSLDVADPLARSLAEEAWDRTAFEAEQAGALDLKAELEDAALRILEPEEFARLRRRLAASAASRRAWLDAQRDRVAHVLTEASLPHLEIQHRVKHIAGVWRKMQEKQLELDQVHDLYALRVIVPEEEQCYLALHAVHGAFEPEPFRFKDYIANPKSNGYRSLHTTVRDENGRALEIQIRSLAMHRAAEQGRAAHWAYKAQSGDAIQPPGRVRRLLGQLPFRPDRRLRSGAQSDGPA